MNKSHIHQFHHNINKSSPLPYVGLNLYLFISKKFILFTWAIVFLEREVNSLGYSFSVAMDDFRILIPHGELQVFVLFNTCYLQKII